MILEEAHLHQQIQGPSGVIYRVTEVTADRIRVRTPYPVHSYGYESKQSGESLWLDHVALARFNVVEVEPLAGNKY